MKKALIFRRKPFIFPFKGEKQNKKCKNLTSDHIERMI